MNGYVTVHLKCGEPVKALHTVSKDVFAAWLVDLYDMETADRYVPVFTVEAVGGVLVAVPVDNVAYIDFGPHYTS